MTSLSLLLPSVHGLHLPWLISLSRLPTSGQVNNHECAVSQLETQFNFTKIVVLKGQRGLNRHYLPSFSFEMWETHHFVSVYMIQLFMCVSIGNSATHVEA